MKDCSTTGDSPALRFLLELQQIILRARDSKLEQRIPVREANVGRPHTTSPEEEMEVKVESSKNPKGNSAATSSDSRVGVTVESGIESKMPRTKSEKQGKPSRSTGKTESENGKPGQ